MEVFQASFLGFIRTVIIIVFVIILLRLIGKVLIVRKNIQVQNNINNKKKAKSEAKKNYGKIKITKSNPNDNDFTEYEDV